ncbi:MAG: Tol-Pal system beta propeller repeat protein TolB, partial [Gammaproteobacteria bacterium]|nr:Tol-Pal system beta propeller repeat protein TolB [Gammaproteobacteria bacterium]
IYLQDVYTGKRELISRYQGINGAPAVSPDGKYMALVLTLTGNPKIYLLNLKTKHLAQMTRGYSIDTEPAWAPDSQSFVFTSSRGGNPQVYRYYLANKKIQRVTFQGNYNARASFLPNGQGIVMMHRETNLFGIAYQDFRTGRINILTQSGFDESPSVAPNGQLVIYATRYGDQGVLAQVSINGQIKLRLPAREGSVREPAWSPF